MNTSVNPKSRVAWWVLFLLVGALWGMVCLQGGPWKW